MILIENTCVSGWAAALRGMRNPMNSWDQSDSGLTYVGLDETPIFAVGKRDLELAKKLVAAGSDHAKFMRMVLVSCDIVAPLYWWKEFDTYKVGTVRNSCSTMHRIMAKPFALDDFSREHLFGRSEEWLNLLVDDLNRLRDLYLDVLSGKSKVRTKEFDPKQLWWQIIQTLPSSYNQRATVLLNYEVLRRMYGARRSHKLDEWRDFCDWASHLPYGDLITCKAGGML